MKMTLTYFKQKLTQTNNFDQRLRALPTFLGFVTKTKHAIFYPTSSYLQSLWRFGFLVLMFSMLHLILSLFTGFNLPFPIFIYMFLAGGLIFSFFCYLVQYHKNILFLLMAMVIFIKLNGSVAYADTLEAVQSSVIIKNSKQSNFYWDLTVWLGIVISSYSLSAFIDLNGEQTLLCLFSLGALTMILSSTESIDDLLEPSIAPDFFQHNLKLLPTEGLKLAEPVLREQPNNGFITFLDDINNLVNSNTTSFIIIACYALLGFLLSFLFFRKRYYYFYVVLLSFLMVHFLITNMVPAEAALPPLPGPAAWDPDLIKRNSSNPRFIEHFYIYLKQNVTFNQVFGVVVGTFGFLLLKNYYLPSQQEVVSDELKPSFLKPKFSQILKNLNGPQPLEIPDIRVGGGLLKSQNIPDIQVGGGLLRPLEIPDIALRGPGLLDEGRVVAIIVPIPPVAPVEPPNA